MAKDAADEIDRAIFDDPLIRVTDRGRWAEAARRLGLERWIEGPQAFTGQVKCCLLAELGGPCDCKEKQEAWREALELELRREMER